MNIQAGNVVECEGIKWTVLKVIDAPRPYAQVVRHGDPGADHCSYITLDRLTAHSLEPCTDK